MADRAEWRAIPGDPRSEAGWLLRDGERWATRFAQRASLGIVGLALYAFCLGQWIAVGACLAAFWALRRVLSRRPPFPETAVPPPGEAFPGRIEIWRQGVFIGEDEAVVTFVEGWLHVEGRRTAFALNNADLKPSLRREPVIARVVLAEGTDLRFDAILRYRGVESFSRRLTAWKDGFSPEGSSVLPPLRPHPLARARVVTDLVAAVLCTALWLGVVFGYGFGWGLLAAVLLPTPFPPDAIVAAQRFRWMEEARRTEDEA